MCKDEKKKIVNLYLFYSITELLQPASQFKKSTGEKPCWDNESTIARIHPVISPTYPDYDNIAFCDQHRADIFMQDWKAYEQGYTISNLVILSLPNDHSAGTSS